MEIFIATDTTGVQLFFNIFATGGIALLYGDGVCFL
jgi:hypothetical protein